MVDGYNIIFAWDELNELAEDSIDAAKDALINMLCNYQGVRKMNLILVFDAYKVQGGQRRIEKHGGIFVVYTKEAETADSYIEYTTHVLSRDYNVTVATSDGLEQVIILGRGAVRMSARDLHEEVKTVKKHITSYIAQSRPVKNNMLMDNLDEASAQWLENLRRGKK